MENKDKRYFLKETGEELEFGDVINLNCVKELEDGRAIVEREVKFSSDTVEALLHFGLIETKEPLIDFSDVENGDDFDFDEFVDMVNEDLDDHERRIQELETKIKILENAVKALNDKKNTSSKKK